MLKKHRCYIKSKVLLILSIVLSVTIIGNFIISAEIFKDAQINAFNREAFATARGLQTNINSLIDKSFLSYTDISNCEPLLDDFVDKNEDVLYTYTTDVEGMALYSSKNARNNGISSKKLKESIKLGDEIYLEDKLNETLYYILPLHEKKASDGKEVKLQVGVLVVAYPRTCITEPVNQLYRYDGVLAVVTFSCAFILMLLLLSKWVTKPLQMLDRAIRNVSREGFAEKPLEIQSNDEIGQIAQSFNEMMEQLAVTTVSKNYVDSIVLNMSEALFVIDSNQCIEKVNDAAINLLGYDREDIEGKNVDWLYAESSDNPFHKKNHLSLIEGNVSRNIETEFIHKDGKSIAVSVNWSTIRDDVGNVDRYVCTARDITDIKEAQRIVMYQANYDELTGLFNRYNLEQQIEKMLNDSVANHVFLVIDLDRFKPVNDVCGHAAGDKLLKQIAYMIKVAVGKNNLVARIGGDEFAVILHNTDREQMTNIMNKLLKDVRNYNFTWKGKIFNVGMSIGAFVVNRPGLDRLSVFNAADRACYIAKEKGGNRLHIYEEEDKASVESEDDSLIPVIMNAFENDDFFLVYQPIVALDEKEKVQIYEVLLRLKTTEGKVLKPGAFMSSIERYNKLLLLDQWVIHNFCKNYSKTMERFGHEKQVQFNINLTGEALNSQQFFQFVCEELERYSVPPAVLCFEITESCVVSNFEEATELIKKLRDKGCKFAIDNFGLGASYFMYLRLLPVDTIKIDGGFVKGMESSSVDMAVVKSINEIAHLLNIKTVAEWVESREILEKVKELGVDYAQGYEIMKPGELEEN